MGDRCDCLDAEHSLLQTAFAYETRVPVKSKPIQSTQHTQSTPLVMPSARKGQIKTEKCVRAQGSAICITQKTFNEFRSQVQY